MSTQTQTPTGQKAENGTGLLVLLLVVVMASIFGMFLMGV
jgi:hypothetical protein